MLNTYTYNQATTGQIGNLNITNSVLQSILTNFARVKGALGYRATVCFRIQAISNPFQGGRIRMAFQPFASTTVHHRRTFAITPVSQLPGVELDLAESTSALLKIPFIHPNNFFRVESDPGNEDDLGNLVLFAYTPLSVAAGTLAPKVTLWIWLEDFELVGAASTDITAQSGKFQKKKDVSSQEADAIPGNVSNVLAAGSNLVTWLGKKIPMISSYSGMASWALREASNVAASYGWAKPIASVLPVKMMNTNNIHQFNCDGPDPAFNLGTTTDNSVCAYPGFAGTDVDEMAFSFLTSIYAAISTPSLSTLNAPGQIVYACSLGPEATYFNGSNINRAVLGAKPPGNAFWPSPLYAMSNLFNQWKGGFKFRIKISKTKFHTGRLVLGFNPVYPLGANVVVTPTDTSDMQFKSVIWDLREGNVMDFECPYISPYAYLDKYLSYGTFFISILDPLAGPDTVASVVPMVVEVAGMEDFEFAVPITATEYVAPLNTTFVAQAGEFVPTNTTLCQNSAVTCVGEKLNSIKQLLSRASPFSVVNGSTNTEVTSEFLYPLFAPNPVAPTDLNRIDTSYLAYFQSAYTVARGGFVVDVVAHRGGTFISAYSKMGDQGLDNMAVITEERTALHAKMPYFNKRSRHLTTPNYTSPTNVLNVAVVGGSTAPNATIYRRAAEDFQLGYFIGFSPLTSPFTPFTPLTNQLVSALSSRA